MLLGGWDLLLGGYVVLVCVFVVFAICTSMDDDPLFGTIYHYAVFEVVYGDVVVI